MGAIIIMDQQSEVAETAKRNYGESAPWPEHDPWHAQTHATIQRQVEQWLAKYASAGMQILNAGSGGTEYQTQGSIIHMDIVERYVSRFERHLVGSIENIPLPDTSIDGVICVGSVINYTDAQQSIAEFSRILRAGGFLILEYERSDSAEFLWTPEYKKYLFSKSYDYNGQTHLLWMYSENHIRQMLNHYQFAIHRQRRFHSLSSFLYRIGMPEQNAARFAKYDWIFQPISNPIAHNQILLAFKNIPPESNDRNQS